MALYGAKPDGTCTFTNRSNAIVTNSFEVTAQTDPSKVLSIAAISGAFSANDIIYFSGKDTSLVDTPYTSELIIGSSGSDTNNRVSFQGVADSLGDLYPEVTNSLGTNFGGGFLFSGNDNLNIDGFRVPIAWDAGFNAGMLFKDSQCDNIALRNIDIDMSGATGASTRGIRCNNIPMVNFELDNVNVVGAKLDSLTLLTAGSSNVVIKNSNLELSESGVVTLTNIEGLTIGPNTTVSGDGLNSESVRISLCSGVLDINGLTVSEAWPVKIISSDFDDTSDISGLTLIDPISTGLSIQGSSNFDIPEAIFTGCTADALTFDTAASHDINVTGCTSDGGMSVSDDGYDIAFTGNTVDGFSSKGFAVFDACHDITFSKNILKNCGTEGSQNGGFNFHGTAYNILLEWNVSANNKGYGYSFHDQTHGWAYHNVGFGNGNIAGSASFNAGWSFTTDAVNPTTSTSWTAKNNISYNDGREDFPSLRLSAVNKAFTTLDHNLWYRDLFTEDIVSLDGNSTRITWEDYHTIGGYEPNSLNSDPLIASTGLISSGSPSIDAGVFITGINEVGTLDSFGNPVTDTPNIGDDQSAFGGGNGWITAGSSKTTMGRRSIYCGG